MTDPKLLTPSQSHDEEDARPGTFTPTCRGAEPAAPANAGEPETQSLMDRVWRAVDVLGAPDSACRTPEELAYCRAIGDALAEIEKLGGRWS